MAPAGQPVVVVKTGGSSSGKIVGIGCGGVVLLVVVIGILIAVGASRSSKQSTNASGSSGGGNANVASYQSGATASTKELAITLASIADPFTSPNQFTQPKSGNRLVSIHASAKNVDSREHTVNEFSFHLKTADNHVYDAALVVTGGTAFTAAALRGGEIREGDISFELPADAQVTELRYDNGIGSDDLFWRK